MSKYNNRGSSGLPNPVKIAKSHFGEHYEGLLSVESGENNETQLNQLNELIDKLEDFIRLHGGAITTNQLRNIFAAIKQVPAEKMAQKLPLLRPKLAYIAARQQKQSKDTIIFTSFISDMIKNTKTELELKSLKTIMEAMVAYHKVHHDK